MKRNRKPNVPGIEVEVTLDLPRRPAAEELKPNPSPRMPRVTRLMALAVKYQGMVDAGELRDYADIARLGYVSRARVTQIMNLANLAPDIQEALLFPSPILPTERQLRGLTAVVDWAEQRRAFGSSFGKSNSFMFSIMEAT
jgi:hypothetical protein